MKYIYIYLQDFKYFIGHKDNKRIRSLWILLPKCKRYFDKTKYTYFIIEEEKVFDKYMEILEKVSNIVNGKFNSELIYNKNYIEVEKSFNMKESFQCFMKK